MNLNATLFAQLVVFFILAWFTKELVWPPIVKALDERAKKIADGLEAAEKGQHELKLSAQRSEEIIREAKEKAAEVMTSADHSAHITIEEAKETARHEAQKVYDAKILEIEYQIESARAELRERVAQLAVLGAERILRREVSTSTHTDILNELKQEF